MSKMRDLWLDYRSEILFGLILSALVVFSYWAGAFISEHVFEYIINPIQGVATVFMCFYGAWVMFRHHEGNRLRWAWAWILLTWGVIDTLAIVLRYGMGVTAVGGTPDDPLYNASLTLGNTLAWMLFVYPSMVLRPGWLTWTKAFLFVVPMLVIGVIDYFVPVDLIYLIMLYPIAIFLLLCRHVHTYRQWCEDHFSSMDSFDVQWIVRYLIILALLGVSFYFICFWYVPNRMFTQQCVLFLILAYSTEQILFRKDPWEEVAKAEAKTLTSDLRPSSFDSSIRQTFEQWMEEQKPYLNPDFQLLDLRAVFPKNRTYLSQFVNTEYGCSFFQLVNRYRIREAKRLMTAHPDMKVSDIASSCGYSSSSVFTRAFFRETGMTPRDWLSAQS